MDTSKRFSQLSDWLAWQENLHTTEIELGLGRCREVVTRLGLKPPNYAIVSVAGTNGKGSSVAMLSSIMMAQGYRVATYTSPHLVVYNERIRINGEMVSDPQLCDAFQRVDSARGDISLTYFEFGTLAAFDILQRSDIDMAVLEVGLGGRLDAVNLVDADIALVTAIGIDHSDWLGNDRDSIAKEKAGILRTGKPAVCSDPDVPGTLIDHAQALASPLFLLERDYRYTHHNVASWDFTAGTMTYHGLPKPNLKGDFQLQNAAGVLMVIELLKERFTVTESAVKEGLTRVTLAGRVQVIPGEIEYILDVAHNPHAARALARSVENLDVGGRTHILIGMLKGKDFKGVFHEVQHLVTTWHIASLQGPRGALAERLAQELEALGNRRPYTLYENVEAALLGVQSVVEPGDRVLVMGSFLTTSAALKRLNS